MFGFFKRKQNLLDNIVNEQITFINNRDLVVSLSLSFKEWAIGHSELIFLDENREKELNRLIKFIDKELKLEYPFVNFNNIDTRFSIRISYNSSNEIASYKNESIVFNIAYKPEIINIDEVFRLSDTHYISRFIDNYDFKLRQDVCDQISYLDSDKTDLNNKLLYPGLNLKKNIYDYKLNPGKISDELRRFGHMSISCENYYCKELLEAIGKEKVKKALKEMNILAIEGHEYFYFKLFDDHRKSEFNYNLKKLHKFKNLINYDDFIRDNL